MLYSQAIDPNTLELIKNLQQKDYLHGFHLVGGTALALKLGHRKSVDIDLFSDFSFDTSQILEKLSFDYSFNLYFSAANTLKGSINNVQIDLIAHRYPLVKEPVLIDNISMLSVEDIIAMKLNAISTSGQRVKDFIDVYYLLQTYILKDMLAYYNIKYKQYNEVNILKSITYFNDVDLSDWPVILNNPTLKWNDVKKRIIKATMEFIKQ
ncbi:MAG: hypothetical protein COS14_10515 [Bacteroidetes bacterium CG02_land_8_20_14_3_00_31_25]|nr:nucleotidyl transferase AbiEii/AbiGii toxin family protein [Bacteroidota bacterium]PIV58265.1 MAG: hypothetical protein COS14_10515 [Bacteroidetes bacterium CG02_land_8_20_14_3_00_31_25]PIX35661.1 MAG: hypothetical protein COZ59_05240 [Bacteroidetes bacterium CG_4_8_14_3_um_filter_31_14]PIY02044.1 MAG: hypothetical protein COZ21_16210 [Bacteroidetes bacterium CG_4_10_14_3_um_filter_31_20]